MKTLSIVLPCRNEEAAISSMAARLRAAKDLLNASGIRVEKTIVVDDAQPIHPVLVLQSLRRLK